MPDYDEDVQGIVRRHLDALAAVPSRASGELFVGVLETVRDLCLELPEMPLDSDGTLAERALRAANQLMLGLVYHFAGAGTSGTGLEELQRKVEARLREMLAEQETARALKHRLRILDADLDTLREECKLLGAIAGHEQLRDQLQARQRDQAAYQHLLAHAGNRGSRESCALEDLGRQVEELLAKQRQLLQKELQVEEASWQAVERGVFGA